MPEPSRRRGCRGHRLELGGRGTGLRRARLERGREALPAGLRRGVVSGGIGGLSGARGLIGTEVPGVLGIGITAPVVLGRRLNDRGAVVPGRGDGPACLGTDCGLDVGRLGMPLTYRLAVVDSTGAVIGSEHPGRGSG